VFIALASLLISVTIMTCQLVNFKRQNTSCSVAGFPTGVSLIRPIRVLLSLHMEFDLFAAGSATHALMMIVVAVVDAGGGVSTDCCSGRSVRPNRRSQHPFVIGYIRGSYVHPLS
jgi:hypothetical protein